MRKARQIARVAGAAVVAAFLLNAFCLFYNDQPTHIDNPSGATDYVWESGSRFFRLTEGASWGHMDENGFNNAWETDADHIDVLAMGSSHTEALEVQPDQNYVYLLNQLYAENAESASESSSSCYAYNIGVSRHDFVTCVDNLAAAVEAYQPTDAIIIETSTIRPYLKSMQDMLAGNRQHMESVNEGVVYTLQHVPLFRQAYHQLVELADNQGIYLIEPELSNNRLAPSVTYLEVLDAVMEKVAADAQGRQVIIVYHPTMLLQEDGTARADTSKAYRNAFAQACADHGITFVNMGSTFSLEYRNSSLLPHGFVNSAVGEGHLNATGHRLIAEKLYSVLQKQGVK